MFDRILAVGSALALAGCAANAQTQAPPEEFFAKTPAEFRPFVETCEPWDDWDKPAPPFKIHGSTYYVGTCGIAAILITNDDGHMLIDSGTDEGAKIVLANIRKLGFDPADVATIRMSHEHFDHVGGIERVRKATGASVISSEAAKEVLETGRTGAADPQANSEHPVFTPVDAEIFVINAALSEFSDLAQIKPIPTPGHSPGALSWQWESCEGDQCLTIVYADSLSPVSSDDYKFSDHPQYLAAYYAGLERLGQLDCDILLTPHPSHSRMLKRMRDNEIIEPAACAYYATGKANDLEQRLNREAGRDQ